jgi:hypothetical protein
MKYVCEKKHFNKRLYKVGMVVDLEDSQLLKDKEGNILYFRPLEKVKPVVEPATSDIEEFDKEEEQDYKCEWCEMIAKSKAGLIAHQRNCKLNPDLIGLSR